MPIYKNKQINRLTNLTNYDKLEVKIASSKVSCFLKDIFATETDALEEVPPFENDLETLVITKVQEKFTDGIEILEEELEGLSREICAKKEFIME